MLNSVHVCVCLRRQIEGAGSRYTSADLTDVSTCHLKAICLQVVGGEQVLQLPEKSEEVLEGKLALLVCTVKGYILTGCSIAEGEV